MLRSSFAALALVATVACLNGASAQDSVGTLTGVITDTSGAPVAGVFV